MVNFADVALIGLISIFSIVVIWLVGTRIVGEKIYPIAVKLNPNNIKGISGQQYQTTTDFLWWGFVITIIILVAIPFLYIALKSLFEKEITSANWGEY